MNSRTVRAAWFPLFVTTFLGSSPVGAATDLPEVANIGATFSNHRGALSPSGDYLAYIAYSTVLIKDVSSLPNGSSFPVVNSLTPNHNQEIFALDWSPAGIVAVGNRASITYIPTNGTNPAAWSIQNAAQNINYGSTDFTGVKIIDGSQAIIGGKSVTGTTDPLLFRWNFNVWQEMMRYNTLGVLNPTGRVLGIDYDPGTSTFVAAGDSGTGPAKLATWSLTSGNYSCMSTGSSQDDNIRGVAFDGSSAVTTGSPGGSSYLSNNLWFGACLTQMAAIGGLHSAVGYDADRLIHLADGSDLGVLATNLGIAVVRLSDGVVMATTVAGAQAVAANSNRQLVITGDGRAYSLNWRDLGGGMVGSAGIPGLTGSGWLNGGDPMFLRLEDCLPNGSAYLVLSSTRVDLSVKCGLLIPGLELVIPLTIGSAGELQISTTSPPGIAPGATVFLQAWLPDPQGPCGFAASNGIEAVAQ